jgi:hypothetical protein
MSYDSDDESVANTSTSNDPVGPISSASAVTSVTPLSSSGGGGGGHQHQENNVNSTSLSSPPLPLSSSHLHHHHQTVHPPLPAQHYSHHLLHHHHPYQNAAPMPQPTTDFKPQHLADWYSHAHMMGGATMRYDTTGSVSVTPVTSAPSAKHHVVGGGGNMYSSHGMGSSNLGGGGMQYVSSALPTPPSSGHSPIQSLTHHLPHLLPNTSVAYT